MTSPDPGREDILLEEISRLQQTLDVFQKAVADLNEAVKLENVSPTAKVRLVENILERLEAPSAAEDSSTPSEE